MDEKSEQQKVKEPLKSWQKVILWIVFAVCSSLVIFFIVWPMVSPPEGGWATVVPVAIPLDVIGFIAATLLIVNSRKATKIASYIFGAVIVLLVVLIALSMRFLTPVQNTHNGQQPTSSPNQITPTAATPAIPAYFEIREQDTSGSFVATGLDSRDIADVMLSSDNEGMPYITIQFNGDGSSLLAAVTGRNIGRPLGLFVNGKLLQSPVITQKLTGGEVSLAGSFTATQAETLAADLNAGKGLSQVPQ